MATLKNRVGGTIALQVDGEVYHAKGNFTYHLGGPVRESLPNASGRIFFKENHAVAYIEGEITDPGDLDLAKASTVVDATVTLQLANRKTVVLRDAWASGEWVGNTEEGNVSARWEANRGEEV